MRSMLDLHRINTVFWCVKWNYHKFCTAYFSRRVTLLRMRQVKYKTLNFHIFTIKYGADKLYFNCFKTESRYTVEKYYIDIYKTQSIFSSYLPQRFCMGKLFRLFIATQTFLWIVALEEIPLHIKTYSHSVKQYRLVNGTKKCLFSDLSKKMQKGTWIENICCVISSI